MGSIVYNDGNPILSGNAGEITYALGSGESLEVAFGGKRYVLRAIADGESHKRDLGSILRALPLERAGLPDVFTGQEYKESQSVTLYAGAASRSLRVIDGRIGSGAAMSQDQVHELLQRPATTGPQERITFPDSQEYLSVFNFRSAGAPYSSTDSFAVNINARYANGMASRILYAALSRASSSIGGIYTVALDSGHVIDRIGGSGILYWDVQVSVNSQVLPPIRFHLRHGRGNVEDFAFVNDIGGIDSIHAVGGRKATPRITSNTMTGNGRKRVLSVDEEESMEVSSGPIASDAEREFWMSFLRSPQKWHIYNGPFGREAIPVIVEDASPEITYGSIGEVKFKFRHDRQMGANITELQDTL